MKRNIVLAILIVVSFFTGFRYAIWTAQENIKTLEDVKNVTLDVMNESQYVRYKDELDIRIESVRHFVLSDREGSSFNKAIKEYIVKTEIAVKNVEDIGAEFSEKEAREAVIESAKFARDEIDRLKFGYNF